MVQHPISRLPIPGDFRESNCSRVRDRDLFTCTSRPVLAHSPWQDKENTPHKAFGLRLLPKKCDLSVALPDQSSHNKFAKIVAQVQATAHANVAKAMVDCKSDLSRVIESLGSSLGVMVKTDFDDLDGRNSPRKVGEITMKSRSLADQSLIRVDSSGLSCMMKP
jgi:hypothetical protein